MNRQTFPESPHKQGKSYRQTVILFRLVLRWWTEGLVLRIRKKKKQGLVCYKLVQDIYPMATEEYWVGATTNVVKCLVSLKHNIVF